MTGSGGFSWYTFSPGSRVSTITGTTWWQQQMQLSPPGSSQPLLWLVVLETQASDRSQAYASAPAIRSRRTATTRIIEFRCTTFLTSLHIEGAEA